MGTILENPKRIRHRMDKKKLIRIQISRVKRKKSSIKTILYSLCQNECNKH